MSSDRDNLRDALARAAALLRRGCSENWARSLEALDLEVERNPANAKYQILSMFGGMGSFNDVVLYRDGKVLGEENEELARLQAEIYDLCHKLKST